MCLCATTNKNIRLTLPTHLIIHEFLFLVKRVCDRRSHLGRSCINHPCYYYPVLSLLHNGQLQVFLIFFSFSLAFSALVWVFIFSSSKYCIQVEITHKYSSTTCMLHHEFHKLKEVKRNIVVWLKRERNRKLLACYQANHTWVFLMQGYKKGLS